LEKIGVVILNYLSWEKTINCVDSIIDTYEHPKKVLVVDNCSPNESADKLTAALAGKRYSEVSIVRTDKNGGFSYGNNYGIRHLAKSDPEIRHIILANNDVLFPEGSIQKLTEAFEEGVAITAPKILNVEMAATNNPWISKQPIKQFFGLHDQKKLISWDAIRENRDVYMVSGCCFMVDRSLFEEVGCFDENVFLYNEENIISKKVSDRGYRIIAVPDAPIIHDHGSTTGKNSMLVDREWLKSSLYFLNKYENKGMLTLSGVWLANTIKLSIKSVMGRYSSTKDYGKTVRETFAALRSNIKDA